MVVEACKPYICNKMSGDTKCGGERMRRSVEQDTCFKAAWTDDFVHDSADERLFQMVVVVVMLMMMM